MAMFINGNPIDRLPLLIWQVGIAFVMLHVHGIVVGLRKATGDRLSDSKQAIEKL